MSDISSIMARKHEDSLQLSGDMSQSEEAALARSATDAGSGVVKAAGEKHFTKDHALELDVGRFVKGGRATNAMLYAIRLSVRLVAFARFALSADGGRVRGLEGQLAMPRDETVTG